jgi:hypothetical protein
MVYKVFFIFLIFTMASSGQNLEKHQWKNRVLLIFSTEKDADNYKEQIKILSEVKEGLLERKIEVYGTTKTEFIKNFKGNWENSNHLLKKYVSTSKAFQVILIGLDGGVKLKQDRILSTEKLFTIIDGMPMRRRELRNNN